jgi:transposase
MKRIKKNRARKPKRKRMDIDLGELESILARTEDAPLDTQDREKLKAAIKTLAFLTQEIERKGTSLARLRKLIFGASTEKTDDVLGTSPGDDDKSKDDEKKTSDKDEKKKKPKGHGRNPADAYTGAEKVTVPNEAYKRGDGCPKCPKGKLYPVPPEVLVRVTGVAPLQAKVIELEKLRCNLCGFTTTASAPEGVGDKRYDEGAAAMIALLRYSTGLPFNRLDRLQKSMQIPLPSSTQWDVVAEACEKIAEAYLELVRQGAQGKVLYNDDTTARILKLERDESDERTGVFTTGIVSTTDGNKIALFFTGKRHSGENMEKLLAQRASGLSPPIQMCDAISHNTAGDFESIVANCMSHARRKYVEVVTSFPDECEYVLKTLREVYKNDAATRDMTPEQRLAYHQEHSVPLMEDLKA